MVLHDQTAIGAAAFSASWARCWHDVGAHGDGREAFAQLLARHAEPHRHYHTLQHLGECLTWCEVARQWAARPAEIELALWFHDAIYELRGSDNEQQSADLAQATLTGAAAPAVVNRIVQLVLATRHTAAPMTADEQLLVDIDLSIFGAPEPRFAEYERQIREEYAFVPEDIFRERRRAILEAFLARARIYSTQYFHTRLESSARDQLQRVLASSY